MLMNISEIRALPKDGIIFETTGQLVQVYPPKPWSKGDKSGTIQNLRLQDESGEVIKVMVSNGTEFPEHLRGKTVTLKAYNGAKGWSGLYADDDLYSGTPERIIKMTKTGNLQVSDATPIETKGSPAKPSGTAHFGRDEYWAQKAANDKVTQPRIERQHSQDMAIRYLTLTGKVYNAEMPEEVVSLVDFFQKDLDNASKFEK